MPVYRRPANTWAALIPSLAQRTLCGTACFVGLALALGLGSLRAADDEKEAAKRTVDVVAQFSAPEGKTARIYVTAQIVRGWHIYSLTTPAGGPIATSIKLDPSDSYKLKGEFTPDNPPHRKHEGAFGEAVPFVEYHEGQVVWHAPIELNPAADPMVTKITGSIRYQACSASGCQLPKTLKFTAQFGPGVKGVKVDEKSEAEKFAPEKLANDGHPEQTVVSRPTYTPSRFDRPASREAAGEASIEKPSYGKSAYEKAAFERSPYEKRAFEKPALESPEPVVVVAAVEPPPAGPAGSDGVETPAKKEPFETRLPPTDDILPLSSLPGAGAANKAVAATLADGADVGTFVGGRTSSNTTIRGFLEPKQVAPGDTAVLTLIAEPNIAKHYHVYELRRVDDSKVSKPTLIVLTDTKGLRASAPVPNHEPETPSDAERAAGGLPFYSAPVVWTIKLAVPSYVKPGPIEVTGLMAYQSCASDTSCDQPMGVKFSATVNVGEATTGGRVAVKFLGKEGYAAVAALAAGKSVEPTRAASPAKPADEKTEVAKADAKKNEEPKAAITESTTAAVPASSPYMGSVLVTLFLALVAGFILNFMPCVLPVIGLKVMSFVQQSGESRRQMILLNVWYSLGVILVFMILATLAIFAGLAWGEQNSNDTFNITLSAVVFVFALSFLGVWEIPIPGFVGSSTEINKLAAKEGPVGAFMKGMLTTVLATPCSGPLLGPVLFWAGSQPVLLAYAAFFFTGLGMASPYLLIGFFPHLVRFLPKPGAWMDTFKNMMGFMLLGTVVYLLTYLNSTLVVPTVALLMGLWASCWFIGHTAFYADRAAKLRSWAFACAFAAAMWAVAFNFLAPVMKDRFDATLDQKFAQREEQIENLSPWDRLVWERERKLKKVPNDHLPFLAFTPARLNMLRERNYTVLVDFTADWCLTCKVNERTVLNQVATRELVDKNNVVVLVADLTQDNPGALTLLEELKSKAIPFYAIYPAGGKDPLILRDLITMSDIKSALELAGPSKASSPTVTAMTSRE